MKIALHGRLLYPDRLEGIGRFTEEVLLRWSEQHPGHEFHILFDRSPPENRYEAPNIHLYGKGPRARHPLLYLWWFERVVPAWLRSIEADVFVSPEGFLPLNPPCATVAVIHDIAHQYYRKGIGWWHRKYYDIFVPRFIRSADRIATVSEFSKQTLRDTYGCSPDDIDVVHNGCRSGFRPISEQEKNRVKEEYGWNKDYFLYVGAVHPRKNVETLLRAYDYFRRRFPEGPLLVLAGRAAWKTKRFRQSLNNHHYRKDIYHLDYVADDALPSLMGGARALCYVSLFEGFGLPLLEAMHAEVPIITSDISSLPEVAGDAALTVSPEDPMAIAQAMGRIYTHDQLVDQLVEAGRKQREKYSWEQTANALFRSVLQAVSD